MLAIIKPVGDPLAFYEVAATVIPVLFLAIVYQARIVRKLPSMFRYITAQMAGVIAFAGELNAFDVLASRHPTAHALHAILAALFVLGLCIIAHPMITNFPYPTKPDAITSLEKEGVPRSALLIYRVAGTRVMVPAIFCLYRLSGCSQNL